MRLLSTFAVLLALGACQSSNPEGDDVGGLDAFVCDPDETVTTLNEGRIAVRLGAHPDGR